VLTCRPQRRTFCFRDWSCDRGTARIATALTSVIAMTKKRAVASASRIRQADLAFERGEGVWLIAQMASAISISPLACGECLGHAHPHLVAAFRSRRQSCGTCRTCSRARMANGWRRGYAKQASPTLCFSQIPAPKRWNVPSSPRKYHAPRHPERYRIITFDSAFHGRTLATLAATGSAKYLDGFGPPMDGFDQVPLGDLTPSRRRSAHRPRAS